MQRIGFIYERFSSARQKKGRSAERQNSAGLAWAQSNGVTVNTTLSLSDEGLSGYYGDHVSKGDLGRFVALCGTPLVPRGSVLIIEDFDRLSRQIPDDAWELFRDVLLTGVEIYVVGMSKLFTRDSLNNLGDRIIVQVHQAKAHEESKLKAARLRDVWAARRVRAREGKPTYTRLPLWVERDGAGRDAPLRLRTDRVKTIREMLRLAGDGVGCHKIAKTLNADPERWPAWNRKAVWEADRVHHVLTSAALWGGYQPRKYESRTSTVDVGEVIPGVYPAVIERAEAAQLAQRLRSRRKRGGRPASAERSMLRGLVVDAPSGQRMRLRPAGGCHVYLDRQGPTTREVVVAYHAVETVVLRIVNRWTPDVLVDEGPGDGGAADACRAALRDCEDRRAGVSASMRTAKGSAIAGLVAAMEAIDGEEAKAREELERLTDVKVPSAVVLRDAQSLAARFEKADDEERKTLRGALNRVLRDLLQGVYLYRQELGQRKAAVYVQVWPRVGPPSHAVVMVGVAPAGWVPLSLDARDFRAWGAGK